MNKNLMCALLGAGTLIVGGCLEGSTQSTSSAQEEYYVFNWVSEDSLNISFMDIDDPKLAEDAPVILGKYQGKDISISCRAWQEIMGEEEYITLYKDMWGDYVLQEELKND